MSAKKQITNAIVYTSVFLGTILGSAISMLANPKSRSSVKEGAVKSVGVAKKSAREILHEKTARAVEVGALAKSGLKQKIADFNQMVISAKESFISTFEQKRKDMKE